ncbi:LamG-like jellyroll fold domain-containing protein [Marinimicrobium agarilyticum]|uniref:LamG-like jellyroll fold domain-containing protein n=1 Tax=Marinimicrobium agarilyticum TaxID=306546 RepID=UPI000406BE58|nr:LamG-like jellyroll fold domain-containing protein [Marinimicrobium agarilyticum]
MKRKSLVFVAGSLLILGGCGGSDDGKTYTTSPASEEPTYSKPSLSSEVELNQEGSIGWQDISVHDPSVIEANGQYYIFGSHLAAAESEDLVHWDVFAELTRNDLVDESTLFGQNYTGEIAEGIAWTDGYTGNWAADVVQAPNGKYWFYYNHCAQTEAEGGCWNRSYLGLAESDSVKGPYENKGIFLRSGYRTAAEFEEFPLDDGQTTWDGAVDPNVIDPTAFYDRDDNLWMVYGSYSGGIFVLAMDETTGMPEEGQGYGTRLVGGDFRAIEGAFVMYSPESDYFYLFYSVAGFAANDGYNIRIARSRNPQGPYMDPAGNNIADIGGTLEIGGKLMGGFEFNKALGEEGESWGYQSPGHNSALYDEETGRHILITHTRFPSTSTDYPGNAEAHAVRVHEMFVNKAGWLVASPHRYVPLEGENVPDVAEIPGYYKFINHGIESNTSAIDSEYVTLHEDRSVTGADTGSWFPQGGDAIRLELESGTYNGVVKWQWNDAKGELVPTFSALSATGATVWGSRVDPISATADVVATVEETLNIKTELTVADDGYSLPTIGRSGATISWESSNEYYIGTDGSVFIPTPDRGDQSVILMATIELNGQTTTKEFVVTLEARPEFQNAVAHYTFDGLMSDTLGDYADALTTDNNLANVNATAETYGEGIDGQAYDFSGANGVRLPDNIIQSDAYSVSFWMRSEANTIFSPAFFAAETGSRWISYIPGHVHFTPNSTLWSRLIDVEDDAWIANTTTAPLNEWQHVAITYGEGTMTLYIDGVLVGTMPRPDMFGETGGDFALGVNYGWDTPFNGQIDEFIVYDYALSGLDIRGAAMNNLTNPADFAGFVKDALELGDLSAVRANFELPRVGPFVSGISWESDNEAFLNPVNGTAVVNQPTALEGDQTVTLTATITYKDVTDSKEFEVIVKSMAPAEYSFEGDLDELAGAYASGSVTGNRIDNTASNIDYVDGVQGLAVNLNGANGVRLPNNLITSSNYSVSLWLKPTAFTDYTTAFFAGASASAWISLVPSMVDSNTTRLWANMGSFFDAGALDYRIPANEWTHIVIVAEGDSAGTLKIYVNGALELDTTGLPSVFTVLGETNEFALGVNYWDTPFNGAIDELKVYAEAISADTVGELYQEGASE